MTGQLDRWRSRLIASDPGRTRLRLVLRALSAIALAGGSIDGLGTLLGQPITPAIPGVLVAMIGTIAVNEPDARARRITLALTPLPAAAAVSLAALLAGQQLVADAVFVVIAFAAVWVRRFGPRGMVLGLLAFIPYFLALFLQVPVGQLLWAALATACGAAVAGLVRLVLLPDRPERELPPMLRAFRAHAAEAVDAASRATGVQDRDHPARRRLRRRMLELRETAAAIDGKLDDDPAGYGDAADDLRYRMFDATLAVEELAERAVAADPVASARARVDRMLLDLHAPPAGVAEDDADRTHDDEDDEADDDQADEDARERRRTTTRQAAQAGAGMVVAIALGSLVSSQRWYWAAIGAFVVFSRADSAGQSVVRAGQRVVGTAVGAVAGIALGSLVAGDPVLELPLLLLGAFIGLYFMPVSYTIAMGAITAVLAMVYGLLGRFSDQLLELRVLETAIGAAAGGLAAVVVLPLGTRDSVRGSVRGSV